MENALRQVLDLSSDCSIRVSVLECLGEDSGMGAAILIERGLRRLKLPDEDMLHSMHDLVHRKVNLTSLL